tara:strand:+ start:298 stop:510 length:213 start_codon:yes stop_codon:yes gene_type:complete
VKLESLIGNLIGLALIAVVVYYAWPVLFILLGASEMAKTSEFAAYEDRKEFHEQRGVVYTNSEDPWSRSS